MVEHQPLPSHLERFTTCSRPTPREPLTSTTSPGSEPARPRPRRPSRTSDFRAGGRGSGPARAPARRPHRRREAEPAASPDLLGGSCRASARARACRPAPPSGARRTRAHSQSRAGGRVRVVAVVDQRSSVPAVNDAAHGLSLAPSRRGRDLSADDPTSAQAAAARKFSTL